MKNQKWMAAFDLPGLAVPPIHKWRDVAGQTPADACHDFIRAELAARYVPRGVELKVVVGSRTYFDEHGWVGMHLIVFTARVVPDDGPWVMDDEGGKCDSPHCCSCGGFHFQPHWIGEPGCLRVMCPEPTAEQREKSTFYYQHPCGCWSVAKEGHRR